MQSISILVKCVIVSHEIFYPELIEIGLSVDLSLPAPCCERLLPSNSGASDDSVFYRWGLSLPSIAILVFDLEAVFK